MVSQRASSSDTGPPARAGVSAGSGTAGNERDVAPAGQAAATRGVLTFIDNAVDSTTGTIRLKGTFPNSDTQLWPGAFVQVTLDLTIQADAVVVPATAVQPSQDGLFIYVVKADRTVEMRLVKVELASAMWNQAPQMHRTMAERTSFWPKFEPGEMRNLAAYLWTLAGRARPEPRPAGR